MAANKTQGQWLSIFLVALTMTCAGIATSPGGLSKALFVVGILLLAASFWKFMSIKSLEGKIALGAQPVVGKLIGVIVVLAGWGIVLVGPHLTPSVSGRMVTTLIGLAVSLVGVLYILPSACNKNAIWKS
jgi:hypothetical protein